MKKSLVGLILICLSFHFSQAALDPVMVGASGIARDRDAFILAADKVAGSYFRYPLTGEKGPRIPLQAEKLEQKRIAETTAALDLEGINILADGRVVVLSETLFSLISETGIVVRYPESFTEFGGIGLEGVDVRKNDDGSSSIAVIWEGGYPEADKIPYQLKEAVSKIAFKPVVVLYNLQPNEKNLNLKTQELKIFDLRVQQFPGSEPEAQRFRAPDIVWHLLRKEDGETEWGFIVLLSSQNGMPVREYRNLFLQRFDQAGKPFGNPIDFKRRIPQDLRAMNWEGMGWFEPGKSLILTFDNLPEQSPEAFVLELPSDWR